MKVVKKLTVHKSRFLKGGKSQHLGGAGGAGRNQSHHGSRNPSLITG